MTPANPRKVRVPMPVEVRESYLEIKEIASGEVITALELLSPSNKRPGKGRSQYEEKRKEILSSRTHLIEIDLLRSDRPMAIAAGDVESHYRILVSQSAQRPQADLYAFDLQDEIPIFSLPLKADEPEVVIALHALLNQVYERAGYEVAIDYTCPPTPTVIEQDAAWIDQLLKAQSLR